MIFTEPMKKITVVVLAKDRERVSQTILELGSLDLRPVESFSGALPLTRSHQGGDQGRLRDIRRRLEGLIIEGGSSVPLQSSGGELPSLQEVESYLDKCDGKMRKLRDAQREVHERSVWNREIRNYLSHMKELPLTTDRAPLLVDQGVCSVEKLQKEMATTPYYLVTATSGGEVLDNPQAISQSQSPTTSTGENVLLITLRRNRGEVQRILHTLEWEDAPYKIPSVQSVLAGLDQQYRETQQQLQEKKQDISFLLRDDVEQLKVWWHAIRFEELHSQVENHFGETKKSVVFSGWIPTNRVERLEQKLREVTNNGILFEVSDPDPEEKEAPPVEMKNAPIVKAFEPLVLNYDVPSYGTIDPTPFVAISYLLMFGMMFGDVGHGLVVALIGFLGGAKAVKAGKDRGIWNLFLYCGISAMAFGVLFGSYFGFQLFPPVWFDYHGIVIENHSFGGLGGIKNINGVFGLTIMFGLVIISIGLIINWINLIRKREWFHLLLDKSGFLGGWVYGFGFYSIYTYVSSGFQTLPPSWIIQIGLLFPLALLIIKGPLEKWREAKEEGDSFTLKGMDIIEYLIMWFVEVLEVCIGFLSHTLSFLRVAGLGISHVVLLSAFFELARMFSPGQGYSVVGILLIVFGNLLVILLEGLSAAIQSLRLNYYEFFSKYFSGGGRLYKPISLGGNDE